MPKPKEVYQPQSTEALSPKDKISQICLVAATRLSRTGKVYLGLTQGDIPVCTTSPSDLTPTILKGIEIYEDGSKKLPNLNLRTLPTPIKVNYVGAIANFEDTPDNVSEDIVNISVTDSDGSRRTLKIGELAILKAITASKNPWQMMPEVSAMDSVVSAKLMYTIFVDKDDLGTEADMALILKSRTPNDSNEDAYRRFIIDVITKLVSNDENQVETSIRGYKKAIEKKGESKSHKGFLSYFIETPENEPSVEDKLYATGARILRAVGLAEISDETLEELEQGPRDITLDNMTTEQLLDTAARIYETAYRALRYSK